MDKQQLMERIGLPEEARNCVSDYVMPEQDYQNWRTLFYEKEPEFFQKMEAQPEKELLFLYLYVRFAVDLYEKYRQQGISDQIYYDTFSDFTIWFHHCVKERQVIGLVQEKWMILHLQMRLFRLGRLQFAIDSNKTVRRLHVHIPEGEPLSPEACEASFLQADRFFDSFYDAFDCESWLLSPVLEELLGENSRILQFQRRFRIEEFDRNSRQAEERVFGEVREDKSSYPENTGLQRALKKYVLQGKTPGAGYGVIYRQSLKG